MAALADDTVQTGGREGRPASGLGLAVLSASSFGLSGSLARGLMDAGWSSAAAVAVRILLAAVVLVPVATIALRGRWSLLRRNLPLIAAYGLVAVAGCQLAYFNAVAHMQVGVALLIEYAAPVVVVGWLWARHGERPGRLTVPARCSAGAGLLLVLDLASGARASTTGILWALVAMIGVAVYFVLSSDQDNGVPATVLAAGGLVLGGIALLLAGVAGIVPLAASTAPVRFDGFTVPWWLPVLTLGVVSAAFAYVTGIVASRRPRLPARVLRGADRGAGRPGRRLAVARRDAALDPAARRGADPHRSGRGAPRRAHTSSRRPRSGSRQDGSGGGPNSSRRLRR